MKSPDQTPVREDRLLTNPRPRGAAHLLSKCRARAAVVSATRAAAAACLCALGILSGGSAQAASTYTWNTASTDAYTNAADWDLGSVPGSADTAIMANGGTALIDSTMNLSLFTLEMGGLDSSGGNITMSGGSLNITNNSNANLLIPGFGANSVATFTLNGGTLNIVRPSTGNLYFQDGFQPGSTVGSTGTVTVNNGTLNCFCGLEMGNDGAAIINVNGGTFLDNGWFTIGKGTANTPSGSGTFNITGGSVYALRNPNTDPFIRLQYGANNQSIPGTLSVSGGTLYCHQIRFCSNGQAGTATFNVSGGVLYISEGGIDSGNFKAGQVQVVNISGGTFRTLCMDPNSTGQKGLSSVYVGGAGTNWTWALNNQPHVNLTTSPGPGTVTFAPESGKIITLNNEWDGAGAFSVTGPGTVVFGTNNTYTGGTIVSGGTLQLNFNQPASLISGITVNSGCTLTLAAAELSSAMGAATLNSGSTLNLANNAQIIDSTFTIPSGVTLAFTATSTQTLTNNVAGSGNVVANLTGNGLEVVKGNLGHTGSTIVNSGILAIGGTLNSTPAVIVTNTGTLAGGGVIGAPITIASTTLQSTHLRMGNSPLNVPGTLTVSNLTLGFGSEMDVKLSTATTVGSGVNDLLVVQGNLTINPNATLNVLPLQQLTAGTYVIATYSGTLTGQFTNVVGGLTRYGLAIDYSTPGQIKLNVTGSNANLVWMGVTNNVAVNNWDVLGTPNWTNLTSPFGATSFQEGDAVTFDDTTRNTNVTLTTTLYPASITFNGNTNWSVTGSGSGRITGGTGITKNGNGTVLLAAGLGAGNDYTGPVNINGGILKMNGALSLGATNGATTVASGATLDLNGQTPNDEPIVLQGTGFNGTNGAINNSSGTAPSQAGGPRRVTLAGDTTINATGNRWDMGLNTLGAGGGSFAGNGFKLTKTGAQQIWMHELGDIGVGDIVVTQGLLGFQYTIGLGDPSKTITVMPGATFGIWQAPTLTKQVVLTNGATLYSDGASNALSGTITLYGANTIQVNQPISILSPMAGTGGFTKTSAGALYLPAANTYSGSTTVSAGSVVLGPSGSIANSAQIALATNTVLDATQPAGGLSLGSGQTLSGSGFVNGNATAGAGAQIAPGTFSAASTLTFNGNLTLNGDTNVIKLGTDPSFIGGGVNDLINVVGSLTVSAVSTIQINPLGVLSSASPYTIMQYGSGSPTSANFHVVSSSPRYNVSLVDPTTTAPYIQVNLTGNPGVLVWKGGAAAKPNTWDNVTTNWLNTGTSLRDAYFAGDQAILDDTGITNIINLTAAVVGTTTLSNNTKAYTITNSGTMSGTLDMEGTSSLRLAISNVPTFTTITANSGTLIYDIQGAGIFTNAATFTDNGGGLSTVIKAGSNTMVLGAADNSGFSGTFLVTNGVLRYLSVLDLGAAGSVYATNSGTFDINAISSGAKTIVISGNGFNGQGAAINSSPTGLANEGIHVLTLAGDSSISASNRFDIFGGVGGVVNGNGFKLTHLGSGAYPGGPGVVLINSVGETGLGDIRIAAGRLGFQGYATMGDTSKTLTVESNAVLTLFSVSPPDSKNLVMNGNATFDSGGAANTFNGPVTLVGTNNLFGLRVNLSLEAPIGGAGSLVVGDSPVGAGAGALVLDAINTYTGSTTISNGHSLIIGAASSMGASSLYRVNAGATLDVSAVTSPTLGAGQRLIGAGTVNGSLTFASGATLAAGFPDTSVNNLTITNALALQPGSTNIVVVNKTGSVANDKVIGLASVSIDGTLVITNVGGALAGGDAIQLFSASSYSGLFANIIPATPGAGLTWDQSTLDTDGMLRVLSSGPNPNPTNMTFSVSGNQLTLAWPTNYTGWTLQGQTNAAGVGITTNWHDVPGSAGVNQIVIPLSPANGSVFYRMALHP